ncbi:MAG TPA: class I SAM-dependent rRNA methyltransferase [Thermoanaerobaculia bacterium]|nr:class I SAM-dependent rRNA methyltransferase [Thermoanaerobaculia bacterium]
MDVKRLTLKQGKERLAANRHPWIFAGAIGHESGPDDAPIAELFDPRGTRIASGLHSPHSQIRMRALTFGAEEFGPDTLRTRIRAAIARRVFPHDTNAMRLIHSEGDDLSGLVVDRYDDLYVVEIANWGLEQMKDVVVDALQAPRIYFKNDIPARKLERLPTEPAGDEAPAYIRENGLRFLVEPVAGQKTGFFLDQRENRQLARTLSPGRRVLNLFSYTGGFGVYAAAGGAREVENVDVSEAAIALARTNHELNEVAGVFTVGDAFSVVRQRASANEKYELVICDPPAFAKSRGEVERAARGYKDINLYAMKLVAPGGLLITFSCSGHMDLDLFQKVIFSAALDAGRRASFVRRLGAGPDHPVSLFAPEGEYLKGFLIEVR